MKTRAERTEHIRKAQKTASEDITNNTFYTIKDWRTKPLHRKIIQIDSEYLMFRIENSRTEIQQLAYIRKNSLSPEFFDDPESVSAQEAQEEILTEMVKLKGKELLEDLKLRKQYDACIITFDGYIVNGNRRTAALKYLGERYIDCVVLPEDATPKDIYKLEQQLQISKDFREEYHWINKLTNIRKGLEDDRLNFDERELASNLRLDLTELRTMLRTLDLVDAFLFWKAKPKEYDYSKLADVEEIFRQLEKAIKSPKFRQDANKREALQNAVFMLIEERPTQGRLYGYVMDLIKNFEKIYEKLVSSSDFTKTNNSQSLSQGGDILDDLVNSDNTNPSILISASNANEMAPKIKDIIADAKAENSERRDSEQVYEAVSDALRKLQGIAITSDSTKLESIENKLEEIMKISTELLKQVRDLEIT